ncbi:flavodoxin family protein [Aquipuribacter hungaricus]|uniref:Flavodoxin family protein n=1 Tax=Aquipuribacter hungaricus TaxID=545624 RepID=A0ABV7WAY4_9MICO
MTDLTALVLTCSLKKSPAPSSSETLGREVLTALGEHGVTGEVVRVVDHDVRFGVSLDEGDGDGWPALRAKVMAADILVLATPIWLGQPSSVAKVVLERLDAEISESDDQGRMLTFGKVAGVAVVGNEDGAHHTSAEVFQALVDVGFTVPAAATTYWVGEAMGGVDYQDLEEKPESTQGTTADVARHLAHLARLLKDSPYPAAG